MLAKDTKLRFWCQKVLPLVYDDSLSYYELLNKVVLHLNQHTEDINALIDFYDTFSEEVEEVIQQMMEDGDFNEIIADTLGGIIAEEYDPTESYIIFDYCIFQSKLYRANGSTTGVFDPEKWDERTVGNDLSIIQDYIYSLNAGNVSYDSSQTYESGTVGKELKDINSNIDALNAGDVAYNSSAPYANGTVGKELKDINSNIDALNAGDVAYNSSATYANGTVGKELKDINNAAQYHVGDTFTILSGFSFFATVGQAGTGGSMPLTLDKLIGNDVTGYSFSGSGINFFGSLGETRVTGCSITSIAKGGNNVLSILFAFPSGTTRTTDTVGFLNFHGLTITFT